MVDTKLQQWLDAERKNVTIISRWMVRMVATPKPVTSTRTRER